MFYVGQKVVSLPGKAPSDYPYQRSIPGTIYTVSRVWSEDGYHRICVYELHQPGDEDWYAGEQSHFFRPVVEREYDISVFTALLDTKRVPEVVS